MIYTPLTVKAMKLAYRLHHGQTDKAGVPYIFHPYHLAEQMTSEYAVCAALLHDTVEDTDITIGELSQMFPREVVDAVRLLTHESGMPYLDYIRRIKSDPIAREVKLADLKHNSDQSRFTEAEFIDENKLKQLREKYSTALKLLLSED